MRVVGKEGLLEELNRNALALAKEVAEETGSLFAGDICNTNVFDPDDPESKKAVQAMFDEQVAWAAEAGVDYVIAETYSYAEEARMALETIKAAGLPAVVTMCIHQEPMTRDGITPADACAMLEQAGADVVGLNCIRGLRTTMDLLPEIREQVSGYVAALPVPYQTTEEMPTFQSLRHPRYDGMLFPTALEPYESTRFEVTEFAREADALGIQYLGLCCGNASYLTRAPRAGIRLRGRAARPVPDHRRDADLPEPPTSAPRRHALPHRARAFRGDALRGGPLRAGG